MITPNINQVCEQAKLYYYDFLFQKDKSDIPEHILSHFRQCQICHKQIYELKTALTQAEFKNSHIHNKSGSPLANMLKLHFSYVGHDITCKIVKPFLPGMLDTSMQISIPTPITTHLDHCPECVRDLKKISDLNLSEVYLHRLSQLFAAKPEDNNIVCSEAKSDIMAFVMMAFHESDENTLKHLCTCVQCRSEIYQFRKTIREELQPEKSEKPCFLSGRLSNNDIFDFVIPYGLDIAQYKKSEFLQSRTSHMRRCPFCLEKIQKLHQIVSDISERENSEVVTTYNVEESYSASNINDSENLYAGFPINVEVAGANEKISTGYSNSIINFTAALKRKILTSNIRTISKTGIVGLLAAAILLTSMLFYSNNAKALRLTQFFSACEQSNNVHISSFSPDGTELKQEQWISRTLNIKIFKANDELVLWNIRSKTKTTKNLNFKFTETKSMESEELLEAQRIINGSLGLTPFYSLQEVPQGAEWNKITDEVYELTWVSDTFTDIPEFCKRRYTLKTNTDLPVRIDFFQKIEGEIKDTHESVKIIEYLSDEEMSAIQKNFFEN
ncbi:MAG: hypothetical protein JW787_00885 [Sedimentisphaerales bacterium]|nr:hypothetical protein [Sedimentisphaerales bacterium]